MFYIHFIIFKWCIMNHVRISSSLLTPECPGAERAVEKFFCVKYDVSIILRKKFFFWKNK